MDSSLRNAIKEIFIDWQSKPLPQLFPRDISKTNIQRFDNILAIIWPRRAGKTYFMYQIIEDLVQNQGIDKTDILFIDFENYKLLELKTRDIGEIFTIFQELYGKKPKYLFFDEIQNLDNRWRVLRSFHNDRYNIIVSGSSSKLLLTEISTELRWRYSHRLMLPYSFEEIANINTIDMKHIEYRSEKWDLLRLFQEYMEYGGFPAVVNMKQSSEKLEKLEDYYTTIFYRDLIERYNIQEKKALEYLMKYSLSMFSSQFSLTKFEQYLKSQEVNATKATLSKYMDYLKESFFVIECPKFSRSPKVQIVNPKKIYLIDPWFIRLWINYTENKWRILENIVAIELFRNEQMFCYFDDWKECDFVIKHKFWIEVTHAIQVTREMDFHNKDREINWLLKALEACKLQEGYILTYNQVDELEINGYKIHVMPVWKRMSEFRKEIYS